jgi:hypothetical protein
MSLIDAAVCYHCQRQLEGSPFEVSFHTATDDVSLPLCRACQELRQGGQLPVELLLQQWLYGLGVREEVDPFQDTLVTLVCLGCGSQLGSLTTVAAGAAQLMFSDSRRMPDGSTVVPCPACRRTNVLESRFGQLVAVRLW